MEKSLGLKIMKVRGVPVYLKPSWFVLMLVVSLGYGLFLQSLSFSSGLRPFIISSVLAILVALGVFIHEVAHAVVGLARGQKVLYISLTLWGGVTKLTPGTAVSSFLVSMAGPLVNLLFAGLLWLIAGLLGPSAWGLGFLLAAQANFFISLFNLVPAYPLDGGHALEALITHFTRLRSQGVKYTAWVTLMIIPIFIAAFIYFGLTSSMVNLAILVMVCSYLWSAGFPALTSVGNQSSSSDRLRVENICQSAVFVQENEQIVDVASGWDGHSSLLVGSPEHSSSWVPAEALRSAISSGQLNEPIAQLAVPLGVGIPLSGTRLDTLDYFNGAVFSAQQEYYTRGEIPLAYPVVDRHRIVGLLIHRTIAQALYEESSYLRRTYPAGN